MTDYGALLLVPFVGWLAWLMLRPRPGPVRVCARCGHCGPTRRHTRGSTGIELLAWLLLLVPGLIYSLWRLSTRGNVCAVCGGTELVPPESPVGRRLLAEARAGATPPAARAE